MPIAEADIVFKYSHATGPGNATASGPATSLGGFISATPWAGGAANDLFDNISGTENANSVVDYRCVFLHNAHASLAYQAPKLYISAETAGGASITLASDNVATSALTSATAQAAAVANETTAPTAVSAFSAPTTAGTGIALSDIPFGNVKGFWVKRTAANTAALNADGVTIAVTGDTAA